MISVGTRDLKNNLSRYLRAVAGGEDVMITIHGKVMARITPEPAVRDSLDTRLAAMAADGLVTLPRKPAVKRKPRRVPGKSVAAMVIEDRR